MMLKNILLGLSIFLFLGLPTAALSMTEEEFATTLEGAEITLDVSAHPAQPAHLVICLPEELLNVSYPKQDSVTVTRFVLKDNKTVVMAIHSLQDAPSQSLLLETHDGKSYGIKVTFDEELENRNLNIVEF